MKRNRIIISLIIIVSLVLIFQNKDLKKGYGIKALQDLQLVRDLTFQVYNSEHDGTYDLDSGSAYEYFDLLMQSDYKKCDKQDIQDPGGIRIEFETKDTKIVIYSYQLISISSKEGTEYYEIVHETAEQTQRLLRASNIIADIIQQ